MFSTGWLLRYRFFVRVDVSDGGSMLRNIAAMKVAGVNRETIPPT